MNNMFIMLHGMTIGTKHHQIAKFIIISIFINMMNAKNLFAFIKAAKLTTFQHSTPKHVFSNGCKLGFPGVFTTFIYTSFRTIFSASGRRVKERFMAMMTFMLCNIIVMRLFANNSFKAHGFSSFYCKNRGTRPRACNSSFGAIGQHFKAFATMFTCKENHNAS